MTASPWRHHARRVIADVLIEYEAQCACLNQPVSEKEALKLISAAYPFGPRQNHPYKQWGKEVAIAKAFLKANYNIKEYWAFSERYDQGKRGNTGNVADRVIADRVIPVAPGQMSLLEPPAAARYPSV